MMNQAVFQKFSAPMDSAHHRSGRNPQNLSDFSVAEVLEVAQNHGCSEVLRDFLESLFHSRAHRPAQKLGLWIHPSQRLRVVQVGLGVTWGVLIHERVYSLGFPARVQKGIRHDSVQPCLAIRALPEAVEAFQPLQIGLLYQVICGGFALGQVERPAIQGVQMGECFPLKALFPFLFFRPNIVPPGADPSLLPVQPATFEKYSIKDEICADCG